MAPTPSPAVDNRDRVRRQFELLYARPPAFLTVAPGRVNVIGEHVDYNGGWVLPAAIDRCLVMAVAPRTDVRVRLASAGIDGVLEFDGQDLALGNGQGFSVKQVIETAERVTGRPIAVKIAPRRPGDPAVLVAGSARIRRELGWEPKHPDIESIIRTAWAWHSRNPRGYDRNPR